MANTNMIEYLDQTVAYLEDIVGKEELNLLSINYSEGAVASWLFETVLKSHLLGLTHRSAALIVYSILVNNNMEHLRLSKDKGEIQ